MIIGSILILLSIGTFFLLQPHQEKATVTNVITVSDSTGKYEAEICPPYD